MFFVPRLSLQSDSRLYQSVLICTPYLTDILRTVADSDSFQPHAKPTDRLPQVLSAGLNHAAASNAQLSTALLDCLYGAQTPESVFLHKTVPGCIVSLAGKKQAPAKASWEFHACLVKSRSKAWRSFCLGRFHNILIHHPLYLSLIPREDRK